MSKFKKDNSKELPAISTASLPDIVFMLLFFFMSTTQMRQNTLMVDVTPPKATEISKLEKKTLVSYIFVGPPIKPMQAIYGIEPQIQLNDTYKKVTDIPDFIEAERQARDESEIPQMITSLKVDADTKMGIVNEIKQELRKAAALHISYSSRKPVNK